MIVRLEKKKMLLGVILGFMSDDVYVFGDCLEVFFMGFKRWKSWVFKRGRVVGFVLKDRLRLCK